MIARHLAQLQRLSVSGCIGIGDEGLAELEGSACVREGRLRSLAVADLPRVTGRMLLRLLVSWAQGARHHEDSHDSCSDAALHLDVSHLSAMTDAAAHALADALVHGECIVRLRQLQLPDLPPGLVDTALFIDSLVQELSPTSGCGAVFARLSLAGCSKLTAGGLLRLAACDGFRQLHALDLSHLEALRQPHAPAAAAPDGLPGAEASAAAEGSVAAVPTLARMFQGAWSAVRLQQLQLDGCYMTQAAAAALAAPAGQLGSLSLVGCKGLDNAALAQLLGSCAASLTHLHVGGASASWDEPTALSQLTGLRLLQLSRRPVLQDAQLGPILRANAGLTRLELAGCYAITDALMQWLPRSLVELKLVVCSGVVGAGIAQHGRRLQRLWLSGCEGATPAAVQAIAVCCTRLQLLELPRHIPPSCIPHQGMNGHLHWLQVVSGCL
jgi:hypothetical protein